jgi:hypothetical protein
VVVAIALRDKLRRLEKLARGTMDSFVLRDGTRHFFDRQEAFGQAFQFFSDSMRADHSGEPRPDPPPILEAISNARDREDALERALGGFVGLLPIDPEALLARGALISRSLIQGVEYEDLGELEDLSEP